ncbi:hypothetical protein SEPCBS57363_001035 [Sporothrix epigloea]|uniref:Uncharacterized protein n=1 Tax=Sporothrix epigloea TaxID=1892477 RepID=A0ABP0DB01_9PEZI
MHFHSQPQTRSTGTGGLLSPNKRITRNRRGAHQHGLGLGTSGATTTTTTRRSPGNGGLFNRQARTPRTTQRGTGGGLFGGSRRAQKTSILPVGSTTRRRPSLGDRINGALLKLKGALTRNPREQASVTTDSIVIFVYYAANFKKAIGDRQMHGRSRRFRH